MKPQSLKKGELFVFKSRDASQLPLPGLICVALDRQRFRSVMPEFRRGAFYGHFFARDNVKPVRERKDV